MRFKIVLVFMIIILVVCIIINTYPINTTQRLIADSKKNEMLKSANMIANSISVQQTLESDKINAAMSLLNVDTNSRMIVTNDKSVVVYDNMQSHSLVGKKLVISDVLSAMSGYDTFRCEFKSHVLECSVAIPVKWKGTVLGTTFLYTQDEQQIKLLEGMQQNLYSVTSLLLVFSACICIGFSAAFTKRLKRLMVSIRKIREGHYDHREDINGTDEISMLSKEFNDLSGRLQNTEELRRQFVSNASHELKTPLASIKLLADSIIQTDDMSMEDVRDFLGDISQEIVRLTRITDKLLTLTKLDSASGAGRTAVDISYTVDRAAHMLEPLTDAKNIKVKCELSDDAIVYAEEDGIYQIIFNIMENAVKYNSENGSVDIYTFMQNDIVTCLIDDTGIGVPDEDKDRIFERFYRVDKARSRETGGTGLGLSIVKKTMDIYGGSIRVQSRYPAGSRFVLTFPYYGNSKK